MTVTKYAIAEIDRFLESKDPEVILITGEWGVGKTYIWKERYQEALSGGRIKLKKYIYVSLFGLNSLHDLRIALSAEAATLLVPDVPVVGEVNTGWRRYLPTKRELVNVATTENMPGLSHFNQWILPYAFARIEKTIICIDDLERKGQGLSSLEVLGIASLLKEQKECKIVFLLNEDALGTDKIALDEQREKVVDVSLTYAPTAIEAAALVFNEADSVQRETSKRCVSLGLNNIRVLQRIKRFAGMVAPVVIRSGEQALPQAISTIVLVAWSTLQPKKAPSIQFLIQWNLYRSVLKKEDNEADALDEKWGPLLNEYGYGSTDEFDLVLIAGIEKGYFDEDEIENLANAARNAALTHERRESYRKAWARFRGTFVPANDVASLGEIVSKLIENADLLGPVDLNTVVELLRRLGKGSEVAKVCDEFFARWQPSQEIIEGGFEWWPGTAVDSKVEAGLAAVVAKRAAPFDNRKFLRTFHRQGGWSQEDMVELGKMTEAEIRKLLKTANSDDLTEIGKSIASMSRIGNPDANMSRFLEKSRKVLRSIAKESLMNKVRVAGLGVRGVFPPQPEAAQ